MPFVNHTRRNAVLLVVLLFLQLLLMSGGAERAEGSSLLESWTLTITSPIVALSQWVGGGLKSLLDGARDLLSAHSRGAELQGEVDRLREEVHRSRTAAQENTRLRRLLGMRTELVPRSIAASVVTSNSTRQTKLVMLDRGTNDGVHVDMPVVAWGGAVGRVIAAYPRHSKVLLITDPNSGVAGVVQRSRAQGMVLGRGERPLDMLYVERFSDVLPGDRVVTSGLDGIFPKGFGVGRVLLIEESAAGTRRLELIPEMDFASLEEALILLEPVVGGLLALPEPADGS